MTNTTQSMPEADELLTPGQMSDGFDQLAAGIQPLVDREDVVLLAVMNGGLVPVVRLADRLEGNYLLDYCHATRYRGATRGSELHWLVAPQSDLAGKTVVVVDDIFDAGLTLQAVAQRCRQEGAAAVYTAVMLVKDTERDAGIPDPDFVTGLTVPDRYVFGCGMDYHGRWRHLLSVYALKDT